MKGYKTIKEPTPGDIISAAVKLSYESAILTSAQAAIDKIGDAAYLHAYYNTVDEVAARNYASEIGLPEDTYSSRQQADGSMSEFPEDVLAARKRRSPEASEAIDAKALDMWHKRKLNIRCYYPYFALIGIAINYVKAHCFLDDSIGKEINRVDDEAENNKDVGKLYQSGDPSANLISWLTAVFLTTHDKYYKTLLKEWIAYINNPVTQTRKVIEHVSIDGTIPEAYAKYLSEYVPTHDRHPEIKRDFFGLLDAYFTFHTANKDKKEIASRGPYFEGTFYAFIDQYEAPSIYVPNITEATYRRYSE